MTGRRDEPITVRYGATEDHKPGGLMAPRMTPDQRAAARSDAARQYKEGKPVRAIAANIGRSYGWVHRALEHEGVTMRPRGGKTR